jgi:hypothetical protein
MHPVKFSHSNRILLKPDTMTDEECGTLPVFSDGQICISCWVLTDSDKHKLLKSNKLWLQVNSGETQPPVNLSVNDPFKLKIKEQ